ncbi:hypothetical protein CDAR_263271 [Caerostris darwini]|uniref:Uncharacterized protein n=1 Tax=Caerostris darwini TaxID=1538125 RepID=A0AAV4S0Q9_9ARAC|nr:hypothetical protein CDAR_263271 [Caerostris darwini]
MSLTSLLYTTLHMFCELNNDNTVTSSDVSKHNPFIKGFVESEKRFCLADAMQSKKAPHLVKELSSLTIMQKHHYRSHKRHESTDIRPRH